MDTDNKVLGRIIEAVEKYALAKEYKDPELIERRLFVLDYEVMQYIKQKNKKEENHDR